MNKLFKYLLNIRIFTIQSKSGFGHSYAPKDFHLFTTKNK